MERNLTFMNKRIENHINELFKYAPKTPQAEEVKSEILSNTLEKFNELKAEGINDETAFSIAISYIGNVSELINEYSKDKDAVEMKRSVEKHKARQAMLLSVAVALYIMCVIPVIVSSEFGNEIIGICMMFIMIAVATGLIIYRAATAKLYTVEGAPTVVPFVEPMSKEAKKRSIIRKNTMSALWTLVVAVYLLVSFLTGAWHITWIIFLIAGAASKLIEAIFDYYDWSNLEEKDDE